MGSAVITTAWPPRRTSGSIFCAPAPSRQWPSLVMPIGIGSYFAGSRPRITEAADASETSCSPVRPPKRMPTRRSFVRSRHWSFAWPVTHVRRGRALDSLAVGLGGTRKSGEWWCQSLTAETGGSFTGGRRTDKARWRNIGRTVRGDECRSRRIFPRSGETAATRWRCKK